MDEIEDLYARMISVGWNYRITDVDLPEYKLIRFYRRNLCGLITWSHTEISLDVYNQDYRMYFRS
jgi:hypothetical protein